MKQLLRKYDEKGQVGLLLVIAAVILLIAVLGGVYLSPWVWLILILLVVVALFYHPWYHRGPPV